MKRILFLSLGTFLVSNSFATPPVPEAKFISSVQMVVQESNPYLTERSNRLVVQEFSNTFALAPELRGRNFDTRRNGNEVVFYLTSDEDVSGAVDKMVVRTIDKLNGMVALQGRASAYRAALTQPTVGALQVKVDDSHTKIVSISAQSAPFRELLKELKVKMGGSFSFLIPGKCAEQPIDYSLGDEEGGGRRRVSMTSRKEKGISVDTAMNQLATVLGLNYEKSGDTYIFTGACNQSFPRNGHVLQQTSGEIFRNGFLPNEGMAIPVSQQQVFIPPMP